MLAQGDVDMGALQSMLIVPTVIASAFLVLAIASMWVVFTKAGKPGWASVIPFYNMWVFVEICGKPPLWFVLLFIPCVHIFVAILLNFELAKVFGKGAGFGLGLTLLGFIFLPLLAFGDAKYQGASPMM